MSVVQTGQTTFRFLEKGDIIYFGHDYRYYVVMDFTVVRGTFDHNAWLADGAATAEISLKSTLEPNAGHMYQLLVGMAPPGVRMYWRHPTGRPSLGTDLSPDSGFITANESPVAAPTMEVWTAQNFYPDYRFLNLSGKTVQPRITFYGRKYQVEEFDTSQMGGFMPYHVPGGNMP